MKFYRVEFHGEGGISYGFAFHTNRRDARAAKRDWDSAADTSSDHAVIDTIDVTPNKAGILRALNAYAAHPDNG